MGTADVQERGQQAGPAPVLLVDVHVAARMLGLGRCTILALADSGELDPAPVRQGGAVRGRRRSGTGRGAAPGGEQGGRGRHLPAYARGSAALSQAGLGVTAACTPSGLAI